VLFHKNFYVSPTDNDRTAGGLTVDAFGNIFAVGSFAGTETFGKTSFVSAGGFDAFVARFDTSTGTLLNKFTFGDAANQSANAVTVDSGGNVYVVGTYSGHLSPLTLQSQGGSDIFVMRMSALGVLSWSKSFGDPTDQVASAITVSPAGATPQQLVFTGATHGSVDFGGGQIAGKGGVDIPLVKLDSTTGAHVWSRIYGGPADQSGTSVVLANGGRSYLTANTAGGLDAGTGPLSFAGGLDVLLAEFAP
jgi:outer membrane protein assembly factor BamB